MIGKMKGSSGTIKSMSLHPTEPYLATVGLDRFLRYQLIKITLMKWYCNRFYHGDIHFEKI
jgi:hypothetical protein